MKSRYARGVSRALRLGTWCCLLATVPVGSGLAQDNRAQGIRAGSFIFTPVLRISEGYDSNIFEDNFDPTGSFITTVRPSLGLESDFSRHRLEANIGFGQEFFHQSSDDNAYTAFVNTEAIFDVTRRLRVQGAIGYRRAVEQRGSDEIGTAIAGPVYSDRYDSELRVQYLPGDFRIEPFVAAAMRDFIDRGEIVDQDDRDRRTIEGGLELGYRLAPGYEAFLRASYFDTDFQQAVDSAGDNRDSAGVKTLAGVQLKLSRLITGRVGLGFTFASFDDPTFQSTTDFTADIGLTWTPRRRWRLSLNASRDVEPTNVAGASDKVETAVALSARYEIIRNLGGFLRTGLNRSEFNASANGTDRTDTGYFAGFGVDWAVTRRASLRWAYNFQREISTEPGEGFNKHTATIGARYGL